LSDCSFGERSFKGIQFCNSHDRGVTRWAGLPDSAVLGRKALEEGLFKEKT
jgi:hypothetical protein